MSAAVLPGAPSPFGRGGAHGHVVVVGGGLAGLSAAIRAADAGARVTLLERRNRLGGATWSFTRDGLSYDNGQHVFMRCCTSYRAFLDRIGSAGKVTLQRRMDVPVARPGGPIARLRRTGMPAPLHLGASLLGYRHLGVADRVRAARTALALRRLDPADPALDGRTFGDWLAARGERGDAVAALWDLVCIATINLPASAASLALAAKVFRTGLLDRADGGDLGWSNVPLQELHGDAARRVLDRLGADVRLRARVDAVTTTDLTAGAGHLPSARPVVRVDGEAIEADAVIVAAPHEEAASLLPSGAFPQQARAAELGRSPIVDVHLLYDRPVLAGPFLAGLGSPVQFVFDRTGSSGAPAGHQAVAISLSAADRYLPMSSPELIETFTAEMQRLVPAARGARVVSSMVTREVAATFRGVPGTAALRPTAGTSLPGVYLAGAWTATGWPATMESAVRSGDRAGDLAVAHLAGATREEVAA